jgi:transposase
MDLRSDGAWNFGLKSPHPQPDNNLSERELRRVVVVRKNYMICGSEEGAKRAAIIYSLIGTCELFSLDPLIYFR